MLGSLAGAPPARCRAPTWSRLVRDWVPRSELVTGGLLDQRARGSWRRARSGERWSARSASTRSRPYSIWRRRRPSAWRTVIPISTLDTNIRGTWAVLEACRRTPDGPAGRDRIVGQGLRRSGASCRIGRTRRCSVAIRTTSASRARICCRRCTRRPIGLPVCVTRCGNFYGGGDLNWNRLVPGTIRSVLRNERPVIRSDGHFTRDYLYVEDGARAYCSSPSSWPPSRSSRARSSIFPTSAA